MREALPYHALANPQEKWYHMSANSTEMAKNMKGACGFPHKPPSSPQPSATLKILIKWFYVMTGKVTVNIAEVMPEKLQNPVAENRAANNNLCPCNIGSVSLCLF